MKKADILAQIARHPETVFLCGGSYYLITGIVREEGWRTNSQTWRVKTKHVGFNGATKTLRVSEESSITKPLGNVDWVKCNDLEAFEFQMLEEHIKKETEKAEENARQERLVVLSQEVEKLLVGAGIKKGVWIVNTFHGSNQVSIKMDMDDLEKLSTILQASIKTGVTA